MEREGGSDQHEQRSRARRCNVAAPQRHDLKLARLAGRAAVSTTSTTSPAVPAAILPLLCAHARSDAATALSSVCTRQIFDELSSPSTVSNYPCEWLHQLWALIGKLVMAEAPSTSVLAHDQWLHKLSMSWGGGRKDGHFCLFMYLLSHIYDFFAT
jgi:hypothetical protein